MEGIKEVVDHHLEIKLIQHLLVMRLLLVVQSDHVQTRTVPTEVLRDRLLDVCNIVLSWGFEIAREVVDDINPTAGGKGRQSDHDRSSRQLPVYFLQSLTLE
jgi:4-hydroxy-L-threonine phosphate dehydrogenase PdxA